MKQAMEVGVCQVAQASRPGRTCFLAKLERAMGFEPTTCRLATDGSTAELRPQKALSGHPLPVVLAAGGHWSGRGFLPSRFPEKESRRQEVIRPVLDSEGGGAGGNRTLI